MTKKTNIALPPQFNKMKRPPAKMSLEMKMRMERVRELYPEGLVYDVPIGTLDVIYRMYYPGHTPKEAFQSAFSHYFK